MNNKELFDRMEWRQSKRKKKLAPMELDLDMVSYAPFIEKGFDVHSQEQDVVLNNTAIWLDSFYKQGGKVWAIDYSFYNHNHPIFKWDFFNHILGVRECAELYDKMYHIRDVFWPDPNQTENIMNVIAERKLDITKEELYMMYDANHPLHVMWFALYPLKINFTPIITYRKNRTGQNPNTLDFESYDGMVVMNGSGRYLQNHFWHEYEPAIYYQYPGMPNFVDHQTDVLGKNTDSIIEECNTADKFWKHMTYGDDIHRKVRIEWPEQKSWLEPNNTFLVYSDGTHLHNEATRKWIELCVEIKDVCCQDIVEIGKYYVDMTVKPNLTRRIIT